jgi:hypothetical protein
MRVGVLTTSYPRFEGDPAGCFVAELALFSNERARRDVLERRGLSPVLDGVRSDAGYARAFAHFDRLRMHPAFAPDVEPYLEKIDRTARRDAHAS